MILGKISDAFALDVHNANQAILDDQGNGDLAPDIRMGCDVAGIFEGIPNADYFPRQSGGAGQAFTQRDVVEIDALVVALAKTVAQDLALLVDEHNTECVI